MSGLATRNLMENEEHAALVDSFFLPGGILDPDDDEEVPGVPSFPNAKATRVPSNPWSNDYHDNSLDNTNRVEETVEETVAQSRPQHLPVDLGLGSGSGSGTGSDQVFRPTITPPPGYTENDRLVTSNHSFFNTFPNGEKRNGQIELDTFINADETSPVNAFQFGLGDNNAVPGPVSQFQNKAIQRPRQPLDTGQPINSWDGAGNHQGLPSPPEPVFSPDPQDSPQHTSHELEETLVEFTSADLPSPITMDTKRSKNTLEDDSSSSSDDDEDDDDDKEGRDAEASVRSYSSIPLELLSVRGIYKGDSLTSSLSSWSCDSDESEQIPNPIDDGEEMEELPEQAQSYQVVRIVEDSPQQEQTESDSTSETPDAAVCTTGNSSESKCNQWIPVDQFRCLLQFFWLALSTWSLSAIELPKKLINAIKSFAVRSIQHTVLFSFLARTTRTISSQTTKVVNAFHAFAQCLVDVKDIVTALTTQLFSTIRVSLATITKALILVASFLFQVWKYSLVEAVEESNVTICYLVFYFMPDFCSLLMDLFNIPHWTPHLMTSVAVFSLCNQVKSGHLQMQDVSIFKLTEMRDRNAAKSSDRSTTIIEGPQDEARPRDERACKTILRILRFVLPTFFLADGFSSEFGSIMGVSGASRLTTAFMMSLVRKNLVSSPIGWVSWAIQVLVATYYPSWKFLDQLVLVVGLSSIRLIRYLEGKRCKEKKPNGKNS